MLKIIRNELFDIFILLICILLLFFAFRFATRKERKIYQESIEAHKQIDSLNAYIDTLETEFIINQNAFLDYSKLYDSLGMETKNGE